MFNLKLRAGQTIKNNIIDETVSIAEGIRQMDVEVSPQTTVSLNGRMILPSQLDMTFSDFGVREGSDAVMNFAIKADSARE